MIRKRELCLVLLVASILFLYTWLAVLPDGGHGNHVALEDLFFWMQMLSGSSWPDKFDTHATSPFWLAVGIMLQMMLGAGPLLAILWIGWRLLTNRRTEMDLTALMAEHDSALLTSVSALIARKLGTSAALKIDADLEAVFEREQMEWRHKVEQLLGKERADQLFDRMREPV